MAGSNPDFGNGLVDKGPSVFQYFMDKLRGVNHRAKTLNSLKVHQPPGIPEQYDAGPGHVYGTQDKNVIDCTTKTQDENEGIGSMEWKQRMTQGGKRPSYDI